MKHTPTVTSVGEVMVEHIHRVESLPADDTTLVVPPEPHGIGGAVVNLAWYLAGFGYRAQLVSAVGARDLPALAELFGARSVDLSGVLSIPGQSDQLVTLLTRHHHHSYYLLADLPEKASYNLVRRSTGADLLVLNGGRHPALRRAFRSLIAGPPGLIAFNPSYAIYEYTAEELREIVTRVDVLSLNQQEYHFLVSNLSEAEVARSFRESGRTLVVTHDREGADLLLDGRMVRFPSRIDRDLIVIGAGDAFLAGFLHEYHRTRSAVPAMHFALEVAAEVVRWDRIRVRVRDSEIRHRLQFPAGEVTETP